ncbi:MAG: hypothetical protein AAFY71_16850 [Bacteroidota bacterium]
MRLTQVFLGLTVAASLVLTSCTPDGNEPDPDPDPDPMNFAAITQVEDLNSAPANTSTIQGDLSSGEVMTELDWAANSSVACFPATRFIEFQGNQLYYKAEIPQGKEMVITVTPTGERKRINVFGYIDFDGTNTPPVNSVISCEAGYELYVGQPDLTKPGEAQSISFSQAVNRGFTVFVCVSGAKDVLDGTFDLTFELQ